MGKYLKLFDTHSQYESYTADTSSFITPNVSYCKDQPTVVHYNPLTPTPPTPTETRLVCKYYVEYTSSGVQLCDNTSNFSAMEIDGVEQAEVVGYYEFDTIGEHTVKYTLADPTTIGNYAFNNCSSLTSIVIPNGVTSIGEGAFAGCAGLTSVTVPNGVTTIDENTFGGCSSLTSIDIPDGVTSIGDTAFWYCSSLTSINIPSSVTSIGWGAFGCCYNLNEDAVSAIEAINPDDAFYCD